MPTVITIWDDIIQSVEGNTDTVEIISVDTGGGINFDRLHKCDAIEEEHTHEIFSPPTTTKYVHQFRTFSGWDTVTEDDDVTPVTWDTQAEADAEMDTFFGEIEAAVARGDMSEHDRADWRVSELEVK